MVLQGLTNSHTDSVEVISSSSFLLYDSYVLSISGFSAVQLPLVIHSLFGRLTTLYVYLFTHPLYVYPTKTSCRFISSWQSRLPQHLGNIPQRRLVPYISRVPPAQSWRSQYRRRRRIYIRSVLSLPFSLMLIPTNALPLMTS